MAENVRARKLKNISFFKEERMSPPMRTAWSTKRATLSTFRVRKLFTQRHRLHNRDSLNILTNSLFTAVLKVSNIQHIQANILHYIWRGNWQDGELQLPQRATVRHGGLSQGSCGGDPPACGRQLRGAPAGGEPEPAGHRPAAEEVWGAGGRAEEDQGESQEERWGRRRSKRVTSLSVVLKLTVRSPLCVFVLSVRSSSGREILPSGRSGVEPRGTEHRLGRTDGDWGCWSFPAGTAHRGLVLFTVWSCKVLENAYRNFQDSDF